MCWDRTQFSRWIQDSWRMQRLGEGSSYFRHFLPHCPLSLQQLPCLPYLSLLPRLCILLRDCPTVGCLTLLKWGGDDLGTVIGVGNWKHEGEGLRLWKGDSFRGFLWGSVKIILYILPKFRIKGQEPQAPLVDCIPLELKNDWGWEAAGYQRLLCPSRDEPTW